MPHSAASDLDLHCLLMSHKKDARLIWVKIAFFQGYFSCFLSSVVFFQNQLFRKILSGIPSECQTVWMDKMSGLIWVQTVCRSYQQRRKGLLT